MQELIGSIARLRAVLLGLMGGFTDEHWAARVPTSSWDVREVTAHLVDAELLFGRLYRGEIRTLHAQNPAEAIRRWSALPGPAVAASLWQHGIATQRVLESMPSEQWHTPVEALGCDEMAGVIETHAAELGAHGLDVAEVVGMKEKWPAEEPVTRRCPWR